MIVFVKLMAFLVRKLLYYGITLKITEKLNGSYIVGTSDMTIKLLGCLILTGLSKIDLINLISDSEKIASPNFHAVFYVSK